MPTGRGGRALFALPYPSLLGVAPLRRRQAVGFSRLEEINAGLSCSCRHGERKRLPAAVEHRDDPEAPLRRPGHDRSAGPGVGAADAGKAMADFERSFRVTELPFEMYSVEGGAGTGRMCPGQGCSVSLRWIAAKEVRGLADRCPSRGPWIPGRELRQERTPRGTSPWRSQRQPGARTPRSCPP